MKFLSVIGAAVASALVLVAPTHAAPCTPDQAVELASVLVDISMNPDCASVQVNEQTKDLCKFPKCAAVFQAKLDKIPDCDAQGQNVRAEMDKGTKCKSSASAATLSVAGAALATAIAAVLV